MSFNAKYPTIFQRLISTFKYFLNLKTERKNPLCFLSFQEDENFCVLTKVLRKYA